MLGDLSSHELMGTPPWPYCNCTSLGGTMSWVCFRNTHYHQLHIGMSGITYAGAEKPSAMPTLNFIFRLSRRVNLQRPRLATKTR